ncbi:HD domain-containing protein [Streptomyces sp. NPDC002755]
MNVSFGGPVGAAAYQHVASFLHPAILNHSVRVWLFADQVGKAEKISAAEREALAVACMFHDAGTAAVHDGPQRFEVEGADAALAFLSDHGSALHHEFDAALRREIWNAIALHTSAGIAERMGTLPRLVRLGVTTDFGTFSDALADTELPDSIDRFPRCDIEQVLGDAVVAQALRDRDKAPPASWPGVLLAAHLANGSRTGANTAF